MIKANSVVLFQGDSVTDVGWRDGVNNGMGAGYPYFVSEKINAEHPELNIKFINRGISGNRSKDLVARWSADCIDLKPDYLSILIGVNDTWRRYDSNDPTSDKTFEKNMRTIIERAQNETSAEILLLTPFLLDTNEAATRMREDLEGKKEVVIRLAKEYGTKLIDLDAAFAKKVEGGTAPSFISADGVHPTENGHKMLAEEWLKAF